MNLALILPLYFGRVLVEPDAEPILWALLINVNTRLGDPDRVRAIIEAEDPDILVLEEISSRSHWLNPETTTLGLGCS